MPRHLDKSLHLQYSIDPHPNKDAIKEIAKTLGINKGRVTRFFQNKRARERKLARDFKAAIQKSTPSPPTKIEPPIETVEENLPNFENEKEFWEYWREQLRHSGFY